jgi:two-component system, NtrC family, response regulator AtoC
MDNPGWIVRTVPPIPVRLFAGPFHGKKEPVIFLGTSRKLSDTAFQFGYHDMLPKILFVDDEESIRKAVGIALSETFQVSAAGTGSDALERFRQCGPDIVLLDIGLPDMDGVELLKTIKREDPDVGIVMVTAVSEARTIVQALKNGAHDYLVKPVNTQELQITLQNVLENKRLKEKIHHIQKPFRDHYEELVGIDPKMKTLVSIAGKVTRSKDTPVLITGESGVGKGILAKAIHYRSQGVPGPFISLNCGAIAKDLVESELFGYEKGAFTGALPQGKKGLFEISGDGTLFLDEIGAMPISDQTKLLSVLENRSFFKIGGTRETSVSSRIIAATNTDLEAAVVAGSFRKDLYYRLNVIKLEVPPLRERPDDILPLAHHFITKYNLKFYKQFLGLSPAALQMMTEYAWPGNIRELRNVIERVILLEEGDTILPRHIETIINWKPPDKANPEPGSRCFPLDYETTIKAMILQSLNLSGGNVQESARILNMPVHKLRYRIQKYDIPLPQERSTGSSI